MTYRININFDLIYSVVVDSLLSIWVGELIA